MASKVVATKNGILRFVMSEMVPAMGERMNTMIMDKESENPNVPSSPDISRVNHKGKTNPTMPAENNVFPMSYTIQDPIPSLDRVNSLSDIAQFTHAFQPP